MIKVKKNTCLSFKNQRFQPTRWPLCPDTLLCASSTPPYAFHHQMTSTGPLSLLSPHEIGQILLETFMLSGEETLTLEGPLDCCLLHI